MWTMAAIQMDPRVRTDNNYIPTLDGWRGIAILMVCITHLQIGLFWRRNVGFDLGYLGMHGVAIFFVLSGYLITSTLLTQERIDLRKFYVRRFFRLMPTAWLYLATVTLISQLAHLKIVGSDVWSSLFFFRNYSPVAEVNSSALTTHFWSLSIEEQFYLAWPPVLALLGKRKALQAAGLLAGACSVYRYTHWSLYEQLSCVRTEVRADGLLVGCILALLLHNPATRIWIRQASAALIWLAIPIFVWMIHAYHCLVPASESIVIAVMLSGTSLNPGLAVSRLLEWQHLRFLGMISYSVYVWQELFLVPHWGWIGIALLPAAALASWSFIERPGIRVGRKLTRDLVFQPARSHAHEEA